MGGGGITANPATWLFGLYYVVLILTIIRIFTRENRAPSSRIVWGVVVLSLPYFGALIYLIFGEVNLGRKLHSRLIIARKHMIESLPRAYWGDFGAQGKAIPAAYRPAFLVASSINGFEPLDGNAATLLGGSEEVIRRLVRDIEKARSSVHLMYYIWLEDKAGKMLAKAVMGAARRGVQCRIMADGLGSRKLIRSRLWQDMREAGAKMRVALPLDGLLRRFLTARLDLRNHRKIAVIDGEITYCGSQNCADAEFLPKRRFAPWVDIMLRITGPVVNQNQILFMMDWHAHNDIEHPPDGVDWSKQHTGEAIAQIVADSPADRPGAMAQFLGTLFANAEHEIAITTPYFVPTEGLMESIIAASYRGVAVSLMLPRRNDSFIVGHAARSHYRALLRAGVRVFEFEAGMLHSKICMVDGQLSLIGTTNLDRRSFDLNYENNILVYDPRLARAIGERVRSYRAKSVEISLDEVEGWSFPRRILQNSFAMLGPIL